MKRYRKNRKAAAKLKSKTKAKSKKRTGMRYSNAVRRDEARGWPTHSNS
jgi:hypothetical protein